jgi:hypothetical protein
VKITGEFGGNEKCITVTFAYGGIPMDLKYFPFQTGVYLIQVVTDKNIVYIEHIPHVFITQTINQKYMKYV